MAKGNKAVTFKQGVAAQAAVATPTAAPVTTAVPTPVQHTHFTVVPPKRPLTGLKFGQAGNAATHSALAAAAQANGGQLTPAQAMAVCVAQNHKSFYSYAINRLRILQPVVAQ